MTRVLVVLVAAGMLLTGCAVPAAGPATPAAAPAAAPGGAAAATSSDATLAGTVTVFAAPSLTETFGALAKAFEAQHPKVTVTVNFGGSSALATQIVQGAPADVFAAASGTTMKAVTDANLTSGAPIIFVTNTLEIAVPANNPGRVASLKDFARPSLTIALCAAAVPCGAAAKTVLDQAGVVASVDTFEQDVKSVLTKIELGEVDAGLVYTTDVRSAGAKVTGIPFPEATAAVARYPIALLSASRNADAARAFIDFVLSPAGRRVLTDAGFGTP